MPISLRARRSCSGFDQGLTLNMCFAFIDQGLSAVYFAMLLIEELLDVPGFQTTPAN